MLKTIYDTAEEIPEGYADLYTERNGKWELTGVQGVKTQADVDRVQIALTKERNDHKAAKIELAKFEGVDPEVYHTQEAELESVKAQLAAVGNGGADPEKLEPIIIARVKQATGPLERDKANLQRQVDTLKSTVTEKDGEVLGLKTTITTGSVERTIRDAAVSEKVLGTAVEDVVMRGGRIFELTEDGRVITKDGVSGVTPGLTPKEWLKDQTEKSPHWWPQTQGGGSRGGSGGGPGSQRKNPWTKEFWNLTAQGAFVRENGEEKARAMCEAAGVKWGATKPLAA